MLSITRHSRVDLDSSINFSVGLLIVAVLSGIITGFVSWNLENAIFASFMVVIVPVFGMAMEIVVGLLAFIIVALYDESPAVTIMVLFGSLFYVTYTDWQATAVCVGCILLGVGTFAVRVFYHKLKDKLVASRLKKST